jgi:cell division protein FtsB|tara:strand:- start:518 stop:757 length:240 start_codon:yes stop_codon:yes gene_type:complete
MYLLYFLINGERGVISYYKFKNENLEYKKILLNLKLENAFISDRVKRLETNSIDLDFLDEKLREKTGFIDSNEILVVFE